MNLYQITEALRELTRTDNDAPRLIVEMVKDVLGDNEVFTHEDLEPLHDEIREYREANDGLTRKVEKLETEIDRLDETIDKMAETKAELEGQIAELQRQNKND